MEIIPTSMPFENTYKLYKYPNLFCTNDNRPMNDILNSAQNWFFDSASHHLNDTLLIRLTEGIKGKEPQIVEIGETKLGSFFPVQVKADSRVVEIKFTGTLAFFIYNESYDTADPNLKKSGKRFLFNVESSAFRNFAETRTLVKQLHQEPYHEHLLCCEDRIFHVLSANAPVVLILQTETDLTLQRTVTWSKS
jgi:hypothetical protein